MRIRDRIRDLLRARLESGARAGKRTEYESLVAEAEQLLERGALEPAISLLARAVQIATDDRARVLLDRVIVEREQMRLHAGEQALRQESAAEERREHERIEREHAERRRFEREYRERERAEFEQLRIRGNQFPKAYK